MTTTPTRQARQRRALAHLVSLVALIAAAVFVVQGVRRGDATLAIVGMALATAAGANLGVNG